MAETATAIGYKKSLVTLYDMPKAAMMNENSPIWESPIPTFSDVRPSFPAINAPMVQLVTFPRMTAPAMIRIGMAYSIMIFGSNSKPTATKKMAENMSRTGSINFSIQ